MENEVCHSCGSYPDADWTICSRCKQQQMEEMLGEPVYIDSLGIAWTQSQLDESGGLSAVNQMVAEADVRNN